MTTTISFRLNGLAASCQGEPQNALLYALRNDLDQHGPRFGCGLAQCGACTVMINGEAQRSCVYPVSAVGNQSVETIESLEKNGKLTKVQQAWVNNEVPQCGYCQSGMIMATTALLKKIPKPTDADIDTHITNICRCGTFQQVRAAIHEAAKA